MPEPTPRCEDAIAYLKPSVLGDVDGPVLELDEAQSPVLQDLGNGLLVSYVVDMGDHFELITGRHLADQGQTKTGLHQLGLANLARAVRETGVEVHPYDSIFAVIAGGNFETSLLLLDDLWDRAFRQFVPGDYVAAVPARDILAFGNADDDEVRAQLRDMIARIWPDGDHLLSDGLFTRTDGQWKLLGH